MKITTKEFAEQNGVDVVVAGGFLRFAEAKGLAKIVEQRKSPSGKGKPSGVYELTPALEAVISVPEVA